MKFETKEVSDEIRNTLGCSFTELSEGTTRYILEGPEDGELFVCIHGFSMPSFVYDFTADFLSKNGYRVLRYDLYGRGLSDRPGRPNNIGLFRTQLSELLEKLGLSQKKMNLLGMSMGGIIASNYAVSYPGHIRRIILVDSAGVPSKMAPINPLIYLPFCGKILFRRIAPVTMLKYSLDTFYDRERFSGFPELFAAQMEYAGYFNSIYSTLMNLKLDGFSSTIETLGGLDIPKLLIWGDHDSVIDYSASAKFIELLPGIEFHTIKNCGHMPVYEKPDETNAIILSFLKG